MKIALLGAGRIGQLHGRLLAGQPGVDDVIVADIDPQRAQAAADAIGDAIVARLSPDGGPRPALGAFVGMLVVTLIGFVPFVGGLLAFAGFGAVSLSLYRALRTSSGTTSSPVMAAPAPSAG